MKISEKLKADEWTQIAHYASGRADQMNTILELFGDQLPDQMREWLYNDRTVARAESIVGFQNALDIYNKNKEV